MCSSLRRLTDAEQCVIAWQRLNNKWDTKSYFWAIKMKPYLKIIKKNTLKIKNCSNKLNVYIYIYKKYKT